MKSISSSSSISISISSSSGIGADGTAGDDEELTPEEVAHGLRELVQAGMVTPEDAEQALTYICAGNISAMRVYCGTAPRKRKLESSTRRRHAGSQDTEVGRLRSTRQYPIC